MYDMPLKSIFITILYIFMSHVTGLDALNINNLKSFLLLNNDAFTYCCSCTYLSEYRSKCVCLCEYIITSFGIVVFFNVLTNKIKIGVSRQHS